MTTVSSSVPRAGATGRARLRALGRRGSWASVPATVFLVAFLVVPAVLLALTSFWKTAYFQTSTEWNLDQYRDVLGDDTVLRTLWRSIVNGALAAVVATALAVPVAYYLRFSRSRGRIVVLGIIVTALFSSYLVRIYAWRSLLGREGAVNWALQSLHVTSEPSLVFFYNRFAVILTLVHIYLPFAVITVFSAFEALDRDLLEAARTLGAKTRHRIRWLILPLIAPGLFAAFAFTFILSAGDYVTPQLVGGKSGAMIGQLISVQFLQNGDYSHGAALSMLFLASVAAVVAVVYALGRLALRAGG
jgi:spermidine/putrescine transport system permease protein